MAYDFGSKMIASGLWSVKFVITGTNGSGSNFSYEATAEAVFTKEVECCLDKMSAKTNNVKLDDVFRDETSRQLAEMQVLLTRAKKAIDCCNLVGANELITQISLNCRCGCNH
jgi:hypothetical protein